jgi:membrane protein
MPPPVSLSGARRAYGAALPAMASRTVKAWIDDGAASMGAALAYYTLFSLAPLVLIVISVAGFIFGVDAARGEIFVQQLIESVSRPAGGLVATAVGLVLMLVGATTVFAELQSALDRIWRAPPRRQMGLWRLLRARVLSFGLILGLGFLLIVSLVLSAAMAAVQKWWSAWLGGWDIALQIINILSSLALMTLMFAMIYKIMPRVKVAWADVWVGALVTAGLITVGRVLIGLYLGTGMVTSGFGAAGSLVAVLVWVYYSAQIFLLGAEFTWVYAHEMGSRRGQAAGPQPVLRGA